MKKRIGIVGCGNIARIHAQVLTQMDNVHLSALADCELEKAAELNALFADNTASVYPSLEDMLQNEPLDAVHICTPHFLHVPMAVQALQKNISVFMEKPPAISRAQFADLQTAAAQSKGRIGICFQNRYNLTTLKVDELLKNGCLGNILGARAFVSWCRDEAYYTKSGWRGKLATEGGGALINQSIHTLDLLVHWLGHCDLVNSSLSNHHLKEVTEVEDSLDVYMKFGNKTACFYATTAYVTDAPVLIDIECQNGHIRLEKDTVSCTYANGGHEEYFLRQEAKKGGRTYWGNGHEACIHDFYRCLFSGEKYQNDLESVRETFDLVMKIYKK